MANETQNHRYREVGDDPKDGDSYGCAWIMSKIVLFISIPFIALTVVSFCCGWEIMKWVWLAISLLIVLFGLHTRMCYDKTSPKLLEAQRAKNFLGYDFGDNFKLRTTGSHDYSEILLDFEEYAFTPLSEFCKSQKACKIQSSSPDEITITEVKHHIVLIEKEFELEKESTKPGFTKTESYYNPSLSKEDHPWIKSMLQCEVDYDNMTLKMFYVGW